MHITISFNEIKNIISNKTNGKIQLDFNYVQRNILNVSYKPISFLPSVAVNLIIDEINNSRVCLSYETNNAIDMVIKGLVTFLDNNIPKDIAEIDTSDQSVSIHLNNIEQLQTPLEMLEIRDVWFADENVCAELEINI